jgi:hypothetical protein
MEETIAKSANVTKVLEWIKEKGDPESGLKDIRKRVTSDSRYEEYGEWFLNTPKFEAWCDGFRDLESPASSKRVLWVKGPYGTGKTTILQVDSYPSTGLR